MDHKQWRKWEEKCTQEHSPACTAACPVHMDARGFLAEIKAGNFDQAFEIFRTNIPFPGIIGRICDHPCQAACKRKEVGDAVSISALERACVQMSSTPPSKINISASKNRRVAVAGGGLSGLAAAYALARKGYKVIIFEASERLGGSLWEKPEEVLPRRVILDETAVLGDLGVEINFNTPVGKAVSLPDLCSKYDAVYLASGKNTGYALGLEFNQEEQPNIDPVTFATGLNGVFAGGSIRTCQAHSPIVSLSDGRRAAISIDRYLQKVSLTAVREKEGPYRTRLFTNVKGIDPLPAIIPGNPVRGYTREEAIQEARRCLQCRCLECVKFCEFLEHYNEYPKRYARRINQSLRIVKGVREANTMINSCSLCGLCQEVCPENFNMGELCLEARNEMSRNGIMPPSTHDFPLRDMSFSNSERFVLTRHQPGHESSSYIFFPGCQLSASAPNHVEKVYSYLRDRLTGGVGLMLRCCGAPAEWAGRAELFQEGVQEVKQQWQEMGKPRLVLACSSCYRIFKKHLPEIDIVSLWELYDRFGLPEAAATPKAGKMAVHDACTTRYEKHIHASVRRIIKKLGFELEELPTSRETTECCGYGGLMLFANRKLADEVIRRRINESSADYVAYCAMCRDNFAAKDKKTHHLLDLIYSKPDKSLAVKKGPGYSQRRENRARLKNKMLRDVWGDKVKEQKNSFERIKLNIPAAVSELMEERLILLEDVQKVIEYAERTGNKLLNRDKGHFLACHRPVSVTYWVEYTPREGAFDIHNVYSHRMAVKGNS